ncbi:MAG: F0F1 ATP synthase subunit delta [bacterium]|nr:F0F1 ATP synthase subunit delta [bacterium]
MHQHWTPAHYARALAEIVRDQAGLLGVLSDLERIADAIAADPAIGAFFADDRIPLAQREKALHDAVQGMTGDVAYRSVKTLIASRQLGMLREIVAAVRELLARQGGPLSATVTSAVPLHDGQRAGVTAALATTLQQDVRVAFDEDPRIIGGLRITVGQSRCWDGTVAERFRRLQQHLGGHS